MSTYLIIWPHQLFLNHPGLAKVPGSIVLFEDPLFFGDEQYPMRFHRQKLWLHRASMQRYAKTLAKQHESVSIESYTADRGALFKLLKKLQGQGCKTLLLAELSDFMAQKRLHQAAEELGLQLEVLESPGWLNTREENEDWSSGRKRWFMAEYYKHQRRRLEILMDGDEPAGGQWSFDEDNRKKVPKKLYPQIPSIPTVEHDGIDEDARHSINAQFPNAPGSLETLHYPSSHQDAEAWLERFLKERFECFGAYEDAIVRGERWLWHGVLTPMLNTGLLTPRQVLERALAHADKADIPLNSVEGFVRQIIGWREFMRATYQDLGVPMRTTNHWEHLRPIPASFYDGSTGIDPIDDVIQRVLETGYCHHIERLMVLGGFMFLCEFDPDRVYRWFMEMFIDSYDWVMVPNVYAMSQHADGGLITTKPYFSGSNYIKKMSDWGRGDWADTWDGLYWRFIWKHRASLGSNPRWAMMCRTVERMDQDKLEAHLAHAERYLAKLDSDRAAA
ncbi:MAG: cryptochrome/photolyase family protein [Pseudomonadota bacterium]